MAWRARAAAFASRVFGLLRSRSLSGWVNEAAVTSLPHMLERPAKVVYGSLAKFETDPNVVCVRINGLALMILKDAFPSLRIEGKPQCHIIAIAKENGKIA